MVVPRPSSDPPGGPARESADWATDDVLVSSPRRPAGRLGRWLAGLSPPAKAMVGFVAMLVVVVGVIAVRGAVTGPSAQPLADRCPDAYRGGPVSGVSCADGVFQLAMLVPVAVRAPAQWLLAVRQPGSDESTLKPPDSAPDQGVWIYEDGGTAALGRCGATHPGPHRGRHRQLHRHLAGQPSLPRADPRGEDPVARAARIPG